MALSRLVDWVLQQIRPIIVIHGLGCLGRATDQADGFASALGLSTRLSSLWGAPNSHHSRLADCLRQPIGADWKSKLVGRLLPADWSRLPVERPAKVIWDHLGACGILNALENIWDRLG